MQISEVPPEQSQLDHTVQNGAGYFNLSHSSHHVHLQVILLTDADVDGAHIRTLLLTFLFRYCRALFEEGHIYVGVPPMYKLDMGKKVKYCTASLPR